MLTTRCVRGSINVSWTTRLVESIFFALRGVLAFQNIAERGIAEPTSRMGLNRLDSSSSSWLM